VLSRVRLHAVEVRAQLFVDDLVDERAFATAGDARHAGKRPERNAHVDVLEVIFLRPAHGEELTVPRAPRFRRFDLLFPAQILTGQARFVRHDLRGRARRDHIAAVDARPRADVHDIVRRAHRILVVLDHDQRIAEVAQTLERRKQLVVVALVQSDGRLVEDIQHPHQAAADLRGKPDALALAAGERRARARKRQIVQTDRLQKAEAVFDLLQNALADTQLLLGEREGIDKRDLLRHAHARERVNVHAADRHRQRLAPQPAALTRGAGALAHALLQLRAHALALRLLIAAFEVVDDALKRLVEHALAARLVVVQLQLFALRAVEDHVHDLRREFFHRLAQREMIFLRQRVEVHPRDAVAAHVVPPRRADSPIEDGERLIRNDQLRIDLELAAETRTGRARAEGIVEREHPRRQLLDGHAAVLAGVVLREQNILLGIEHVDKHQSARERRSGLRRVAQAMHHIGL